MTVLRFNIFIIYIICILGYNNYRQLRRSEEKNRSQWKINPGSLTWVATTNQWPASQKLYWWYWMLDLYLIATQCQWVCWTFDLNFYMWIQGLLLYKSLSLLHYLKLASIFDFRVCTSQSYSPDDFTHLNQNAWSSSNTEWECHCNTNHAREGLAVVMLWYTLITTSV